MTTTEDTPTPEIDSSAPTADEQPPQPPPVVIDWQHLPRAICAGLVVAQSKATTVDNDGEVKAEKRSFKFPTTAAIACRAREALSAGGLALVATGWVSNAQGSGIRVGWVLVHTDGSVSPTIYVSMPMANGSDRIKAIGATMSYTRKYLLASLLNMGWVDPREEVETMNEQQNRGRGGRGGVDRRAQNGPHQNQRGVEPDGSWDTARSAPTKPPVTRPDPEPSLIARAKVAYRQLRDEFKVHAEMIHQYATGIVGGAPESMTRAELTALIMARDVCVHATANASDGQPNLEVLARHTVMVSYLVDVMGAKPVYISGRITPDGEAANRVPPADGPASKPG